MAKQGYVYPTLVQAKAIPLALSGRDLLVRAKCVHAYFMRGINRRLESKYGLQDWLRQDCRLWLGGAAVDTSRKAGQA